MAKPLAILSDIYISPLLARALRENEVPALVLSGGEESGGLGKAADDLVSLSKAEAARALSEGGAIVYTNAEDVLPFIIDNCSDDALVENVRLFKDKARMRKFFSQADPDFFFLEVGRDDFRRIDAKDFPANKDLIVKPAVGFLAAGIRKVKGAGDLERELGRAVSDVGKHVGLLDSSVLNADRFLIEEYVSGEEYAVDAYFDSRGEVIVLGIYHHPFLNEDDSRNVIYQTNPRIMRELLTKVEEFLNEVAFEEQPRNFPIHFEFRVREGRIVPIEVNPMRFGGFSLGDLSFFAYGVNSYEHFLLGKRPDWDGILSRHSGENYFFLWAAPESMPEGRRPDHEKLKATFENLVEYYELDYKKYPAFAIGYGRSADMEESLKYLEVDFRDFFEE